MTQEHEDIMNHSREVIKKSRAILDAAKNIMPKTMEPTTNETPEKEELDTGEE